MEFEEIYIGLNERTQIFNLLLNDTFETEIKYLIIISNFLKSNIE